MTDFISRTELLQQNREAARAAFPWNSGMIHLACANLYTMRGEQADPAALKTARQVIRNHVGLFSNFRGLSEDLLAAVLDLSGNAETLLASAMGIYTELKKSFFSSSYLPMTALTIARLASPAEYMPMCERTAVIYRRMKEEHPWLTGSDDSAMCALLALSGQDVEDMIQRMEACYARLKGSFSGNALQTLSHVLTLMPGRTEDLCDRTEALFDAFKAAHRKWGTQYELPVLGVLAADPRPIEQIVTETIACDDHLHGCKGFGPLSISRTQRLMYAGLLCIGENDAAEIAGVTSILTAVISEEIAITCIMAASAASAAASSSH